MVVTPVVATTIVVMAVVWAAPERAFVNDVTDPWDEKATMVKGYETVVEGDG